MSRGANNAPGAAGQNGALNDAVVLRMVEVTALADELIEHNRKRLLMEAVAPDLLEALRSLARIADAYDANELDDEARKYWGEDGEFENARPTDKTILYTGRGGRTLLTLADCFAARAAIAKATGESAP